MIFAFCSFLLSLHTFWVHHLLSHQLQNWYKVLQLGFCKIVVPHIEINYSRWRTLETCDLLQGAQVKLQVFFKAHGNLLQEYILAIFGFLIYEKMSNEMLIEYEKELEATPVSIKSP